jgi:hypothetical protein
MTLPTLLDLLRSDPALARGLHGAIRERGWVVHEAEVTR